MKKFFQNRYTAKLMAGWAALLMLVCPMFQVSAEDLPPPTAAVGVVEPIEEKQKTEEIGTVERMISLFRKKSIVPQLIRCGLLKRTIPVL